MIHFLESLGIVKKDTNTPFNMASAILMMLLMLTFVGTTLYILISSLS